MRYTGLKVATATAFAVALITGALGAAPTAGAAVTGSQITTPSTLGYVLDTGSTSITVSGMTIGAAPGDHVDINCYYGTSSATLVSNVAVANDGSFSVTTPLHPIDDHLCTLRAVPAGTTPNDLTPFAGPAIAVSSADTKLNGSQTYDFYDYGQQQHGAFDYVSLGAGGVYDGYLSDSTFKQTTTTFYDNAYFYDTNADGGTRSELQVDGANAYPPEEAERINASATGLPTLHVSQSIDAKTGDLVIHETEPIVRCFDPTYPPTNVTCTAFVATGVTDHRTITQNNQGLVCWVTDVFTSTDKTSHKLDLLWENDNHFHGSTGDASQIEYKFPGQSGYALSTINENVKLPAKPGTILLRMSGAADGDTSTGRGAIVYDTATPKAVFTYDQTEYSVFELPQTTTVPAGGTKRFRFAYVQAYQQATVDKLAKLATSMFAGCTVPRVVGKTLTAAKKAIIHAHCAVGTVKRRASSTIANGIVVSELPRAGKHVDYGTKVALVVSKGKRTAR